MLTQLETLLSYVWLTGFAAASIRTFINRRITVRLIKANKLITCAAYFHWFRSRITLPPGFENVYTPVQREMLLAHERQHVRQHDPLLFSFMQTLNCVFWFCPLAGKTIGLIRHDRELLCDERVMSRFSKQAYGMLLLHEAERALSGYELAGIAFGADSMTERIGACVVPIKGRRKEPALAVSFAVCVLALGLIGAVNPIGSGTTEAFVSTGTGDGDTAYIEGADRFVTVTPNGSAIDEAGLYECLTEAGYQPEQLINISIAVTRPGLFNVMSGGTGTSLLIGELLTEEVLIPHSVLTALFGSM
jgi:hypothetical protein